MKQNDVVDDDDDDDDDDDVDEDEMIILVPSMPDQRNGIRKQSVRVRVLPSLCETTESQR